ncbi:C40 family peptidase, partial [Brevibacterium luteolum]
KKKDDSKKDKPKKDEKKSKAQQEKELRDNIIKTARKGMGVRYVWGGNTTKGWDCSGYTVWVYKQNGINLPRHTSAQKAAGKVIPASQAKPGDLIWVPGHIGIVSETKGQMYDAGSKRTGTTKRSYSWMLKRGAVFVRVID